MNRDTVTASSGCGVPRASMLLSICGCPEAALSMLQLLISGQVSAPTLWKFDLVKLGTDRLSLEEERRVTQ